MLDFVVGNFSLPDPLLRGGAKLLIGQRKREVHQNYSQRDEELARFAASLRDMPIAVQEEKANEQHYELPAEFYLKVLGEHLKYSCCSWDEASNLDDAEVEMLEKTIDRAELCDGQRVLDMGCGWGSLSLYAAQKFPNSQFTAVSNSQAQKDFIDRRSNELGRTNGEVFKENIVYFDRPKGSVDRVVSVEMLEHMKNYQTLFQKVSKWLKDKGKFFVHIFSHSFAAYHFEVKSETDWMSKHFFSGGMMPADKLFYHFQDDVKIEKHWELSGIYYGKTGHAWLENMDANKDEIINIFEQTYGKENAMKWFRYWRIFFIACEELWSYDKGNEWIVSHYLFRKTH